ncbi:OLC1v1024195C1 [Oldenlandia corymbosa var. corymbosa]|uniref:Small RNA 2'-O-methyltransferase n=1 Tax=Oldenlandia corymbosa var. corymbosa TaxID=529605 RepID=A0AAV1C1N3_OLDCO|nr:OLC1v1024195C1 [Oldenlandia corymbosa var. corymbosa]
MGTLQSQAVAAKKSTLTPKAIINQKFGSKALYTVEEVEESSQNDCPGLAIQQKRPCLYRCCLQLPELSVVSEPFKRKKDAEQAAAEKAIKKLGIHLEETIPTVEEAWQNLVDRLSYLFSSEFLSSVHPLSGHFRAAMRRSEDLYGCVPISVLVIFDAKLNNLCKIINPNVESNLLLGMSIVATAAARPACSLLLLKDSLSLKRQNLLPPDVLQSLETSDSRLSESIQIQVVRIPSSVDLNLESLALNISSGSYYLDVIAQALETTNASGILISKTIGRASSETRLYFTAPKHCRLDLEQSSNPLGDVTNQHEEPTNVRASYMAGQQVYGDAVLASVGYKWNTGDLFHEDVTLQTYFRLLISKIPNGVYKLSREAILAAELPVAYTTKSSWRGLLPREILCTFCRHYRLAEPVFSVFSKCSENPETSYVTCKKLKEGNLIEEKGRLDPSAVGGQSEEPGGAIQCEVKMFSKHQELILHCLPTKTYKKETDAIQNAALKVISWLDALFKEYETSLQKLSSLAKKLEIQFYSEFFVQEFKVLHLVPNLWISTVSGSGDDNMLENSFTVAGQATGGLPSSGSFVCISYSVCLVTEVGSLKEHVESNEEFEFEIGNGGVLPFIEGVVTQISVGQSASFRVELPPKEFVLAAADDALTTLSILSSGKCSLEYCVTLLRVTEPLEDRMEQALFSPPLSKQRVEYALQHIRESCALSLVDFGCGSGSLLDSLLNYPTSLEKIVGVDISQKALARAAKMLHSKLKANAEMNLPTNRIESAVLYEGSITSYDSRLCGFDIGTCLEVIEHMEEHEASLFGDVVLSSFCPMLLIISTPNYEYNVILQKSTQNQEEDPDEKNQLQSCKFRNDDHKFEWTRAQFRDWAIGLSERHNYNVEFSGVGGVVDVEPGFASQIAVFRRKEDTKKLEMAHHLEVIWEWSKENI